MEEETYITPPKVPQDRAHSERSAVYRELVLLNELVAPWPKMVSSWELPLAAILTSCTMADTFARREYSRGT